MSSSSRSCSAAGPGSTRRETPQSCSTSGPDRVRQLTQRLLEAGRRRRHDDPLPRRLRVPRRLRRAGPSRTRSPRCSAPTVGGSSTRRRRRSTRTSPTSSTAASRSRGTERSGSSSRRRAMSPSYDLKPEMSAREVAARVAAALGDGISFCVVNFANPDMVGHTGVIPAVVAAVETADACLGRGRRGDAPRGRRLPRHRRPRERGEAPRGRRRQPAHGAHDQSGAARPDPRRRGAQGRRRALRPRPDRPRSARARAARRDDGNDPRAPGNR